jgi:hypothetical protein
MKTKNFMYLAVFTLMTTFLFVGCSDDDDDSNPVNPQNTYSNIRVIHTSYDAPAVDVWVDGTVAISNLDYGKSSGYAQVLSGTHNIQVTPTGQNTPVVIDADVDLTQDMDYSVFAVDQLSMIEPLVAEDMRTPSTNMAKVRFLHSSPDAPAVDIKLNNGSGPAVFSNVAFKDITSYAEVAEDEYVFAVTATGSMTEVVVFAPIQVMAGNVYTVVAHGTLDANDNYDFAVRVFVDNGMGDAYVDLTQGMSNLMVVHASPDAPGVDLLVDDMVVNTSALNFPDATDYLMLNAGTRNIKVNVNGTATTVIEADLGFNVNNYYSVFAVNEVAMIEPLVLMDDMTTPAMMKSHVRFIHLSPDAPAVDITLTDGTVVFGDIEFKEYTMFTPLDAATYDLQVRLAGTSTVVLDLPGITLMDGKIYTVWASGFAGGSPALSAQIIENN